MRRAQSRRRGPLCPGSWTPNVSWRPSTRPARPAAALAACHTAGSGGWVARPANAGPKRAQPGPRESPQGKALIQGERTPAGAGEAPRPGAPCCVAGAHRPGTRLLGLLVSLLPLGAQELANLPERHARVLLLHNLAHVLPCDQGCARQRDSHAEGSVRGCTAAGAPWRRACKRPTAAWARWGPWPPWEPSPSPLRVCVRCWGVRGLAGRSELPPCQQGTRS